MHLRPVSSWPGCVWHNLLSPRFSGEEVVFKVALLKPSRDDMSRNSVVGEREALKKTTSI